MRTPAKRAGMPQDVMNVTKGRESSPPNFHKIPKRNICRCLEGAPVHISQQYWTLGLCIVQADRFSGCACPVGSVLEGPARRAGICLHIYYGVAFMDRARPAHISCNRWLPLPDTNRAGGCQVSGDSEGIRLRQNTYPKHLR